MLAAVDASVDYLPRQMDERLRSSLTSFPIVVVDGPRGVGKTTSAEQLASSTVRLPQDAPLLATDAVAVLASLEPPVLIDEWQLAGTDLLWALKRIVDDDPTPGQFILTGSVEPATYGPTYPLTGRAANLIMRPMSSRELAGNGDTPSLLHRLELGHTPNPGNTASTFATSQLFATGFPGARLQPDPSMFLEGYAALVAQRAGDEGRDASRLLRTLAVLGALTAQAVPDQRIWEAADINKATWKFYDDLLQRVHLAAPVPALASNVLKRLTRYPKRFLGDTALALAVAKLTAGDLSHEPSLVGRYLESFVAQQLRPQVDSLGGTLWHLRAAAGSREIDFVVEVNERRYAFEVKASTRPSTADARGLQWLQAELGDRFTSGFVMHTGAETYPLDNDIWAVPVSEL